MSGYVVIEHDGETYEAEYHEVGGVVTVYGDAGDPNKTEKEFMTMSGMSPDTVAKILLRRLAKRGSVYPKTL